MNMNSVLKYYSINYSPEVIYILYYLEMLDTVQYIESLPIEHLEHQHINDIKLLGNSILLRCTSTRNYPTMFQQPIIQFITIYRKYNILNNTLHTSSYI